MTEPTQVLQRILDEQGYIVVGWHAPAVKGQIFERVLLNDESVFAPVVVIGEAEGHELVAQERRYTPNENATGVSTWEYHFKVAAE